MYEITSLSVNPHKPVNEEKPYTEKQLFKRRWKRIVNTLTESGYDLNKIMIVGRN